MSPNPLPPLLENVNTGWRSTEVIMKWFSRLVNKAYAWSDGIIKFRQDRTNNQYKIRKAEDEAYRIMEEQRAGREAANKVLGKRDTIRSSFEDLELDLEEFGKYLETLE
jgi:hypothetical protein